METTYKITERTDIDKAPSIVHVISLRDGCAGGGWYRQIMSIETMRDRVLTRWVKHWREKHYNTIESMIRFKSIDDTDELVEETTRKHLLKYASEEEVNELFPKKTEIHHDSVWDFYKHIGYDYKDKRVANIDAMILFRDREPNPKQAA